MLYDIASVMKAMRSRITDRLYLSKNPDVFIDLNDVAQHQVDGVRYLYKQFKKKKPGLILNEPQGHGNGKQILLFLEAIHNVVEAPILVLCNEDNLGKWERRFWMFLNDSSQIIAQTDIDPFAKCRVFITPAENASLCARRPWSIIVIDYEENKNILKTKLDGFKIWITSVDMKDHLELFSAIYQWFYPKDKFLISSYVAEAKNASNVVRNTLLLDALMAGIVLRRNEIAVEYNNSEFQNNNNKELKPVTKRGKRRRDADVTVTTDKTHSEITNKKSNPINSVKVNKVVDFKDVESFIRTHKPITSHNFKSFHFKEASYKKDEKTISKKKKEKSNSEKEHNITTEVKNNESVLELFEVSFEDNADNEFKMATESDVDLKDNVVNENTTISDSEIHCEYQNDITVIIKTEDVTTDENEIEIVENKVGFQTNIDDEELVETSDVNSQPTNEIELENDENKVGFQTNNVVEELVKTSEINSQCTNEFELENDDNKVGFTNSVVEETNSEINSSVDKDPKTDLERKILELEQETMKKFKGSFLDSIF